MTLTHYLTVPHFDALNIYIAVENIVKKGEIACNKQFLLFHNVFYPIYGTYFPCYTHFEMSSAICFSLDQSKKLSSGNGLTGFQKSFQSYHGNSSQ